MAKINKADVQALLQDAFAELMGFVATNGAVKPEYRKEDDSGLGLDPVNIVDFSKVLASSHMQDIVLKYATKIMELGDLEDKDISDIVGGFVRNLAEYISTTHSDIVDETSFEAVAKEKFAETILQATKEKQNSISGTDDDTGASSREENEMAQNERNINANIVNITTSPYSGNAFNFIIDTADKKGLSGDTLINVIVNAITQTNIDINAVLAAIVDTDVKFGFVVDGNPVEIKDAKNIIIAHIKTIISSRTDILNVFVDAMFKDIKVDVTADVIARIDTLSVSLGIDKAKLVEVINARIKDINIEYDKKGTLVVKKAVATALSENRKEEMVAKFCELIGIKDGKLSVNVDLTEDVIKAMNKVAVIYDVDVNALVSAISDVNASINFTKDGKAIKPGDVETEIVFGLYDSVVQKVADIVRPLISDIHENVDVTDIVSQIADISAFYDVDVEKLIQALHIENDGVKVKYIGKDGKVIDNLSLYNVLRDGIKKRTDDMAKGGVQGEVQKALEGLKIEKTFSMEDIKEVVSELEGISAKYRVPVDDLINALVKKSFESGTASTQLYDKKGNVITVEQFREYLMTSLDKEAEGKLKDSLNKVITELPKTGSIDIATLVGKLQPISRTYNVSLKQLVEEMSLHKDVKIVVEGMDKDNNPVTYTLPQDKDALVSFVATAMEQTMDDNAAGKLEGVLKEIADNVKKTGKITDFSDILNRIAEASVTYNISVDTIVKLLSAKFSVVIPKDQIDKIQTKLDEDLKQKAFQELLKNLGITKDDEGKLSKTIKLADIADQITDVALKFNCDPDELFGLLKNKTKMVISDNDIANVKKQLEKNYKEKALQELVRELAEVEGTLDATAVADKITTIAIKFHIDDPMKLAELLASQKKLNVSVDMDAVKGAIAKKAAELGADELVKGLNGLDGTETDLDKETLDRIIASSGKVNINVKLSKESREYIINGLIKASKLTYKLDDETLEELRKAGIKGLTDNMSFSDVFALINNVQTNGGITNIQQNNMFHFMMGMYAGNGFVNQAAPVCRPCMMQPQMMPYPVYMPVPMPVMQGGYPGMQQGIVGGGQTVVMPPYWPGFPQQPNNNEDILKAIKELNDNLTKKLEELTNGSSTGGTPAPVPPVRENYTPTEDEVKAAIIAILKSYDKLADLPPAELPKLVIEVIKIIQKAHPDKEIVGVDSIVSMLYATATKGKKPEKVDDDPVDDDTTDDTMEDDDMDFSKDPIEPKRSRWQRFKSWCGRHKGILIGIPLLAAAGAIGVGAGAAAIVGTGVTEGLGAVIAHGIANSALGQFVTWNGPIAATVAGALGVGGVASTVIGAVPMGKKASIAHSYNGVLKSRNKVRAANARSRELITRQLGFQSLLKQKQDEMAAYSSSPKDLERLNKEVTNLRKKIARNSKKMAKASNKETDKLVDEIKKVARLNRKEQKHDYRVAGSKSINKKGYTQKYIDLLTKRRSGQITQQEFEEQLAAIPVQYRNTKYTTFKTELEMDVTENRRTTQDAKKVRAGEKPDSDRGYPDFEEDKEL